MAENSSREIITDINDVLVKPIFYLQYITLIFFRTFPKLPEEKDHPFTAETRFIEKENPQPFPLSIINPALSLYTFS